MTSEYRAEIPVVTNVFWDLNIDSITLMTIIAEFENRYDVALVSYA